MNAEESTFPAALYKLDKSEYSQLVDYLNEHKMLIDFYQRIIGDPQLSKLGGLAETIASEVELIKDIAKQQRLHIMQLLQAYEGNYVVLKGVTTEVLTKDSSLFRESGDWDIWAEDPEEFTKYALHNGFSQYDESCAPHEFSKLFYSDNINVEIEVHQSFPNISIPSELLDRDVAIKVGYVSLTYPVFSDIADEIVQVEWKDRGHIHIFSAEMAALLMCMNVYKDYLWEPYKIPNIRLHDLIEIQRLSACQEFSSSKFSALAEKMCCQQAVSFVFKLLQSFFREIKIPNYHVDLRVRKLMNDIFSIFTIQDSMDFYQNLCSETFAERIESLAPNAIRLNEEQNTRTMANVYRSAANPTEKQFDFRFCFSPNEGNITLTYAVEGVIEERDNFFVIFRNHMEHLHIHKDTDGKYFFESYGLEHDESFEIDEDSNTFKIQFNFSRAPKDAELYSVIAVEKFMDGNRFQTIIPVILDWPCADQRE